MTKKPLKKGNVYAHAKSSRTKVTFNKPKKKAPAKKTPARKAAVKRAPARKVAAPKYKYRVQAKKTLKAQWITLFATNFKTVAFDAARVIAKKSPGYTIRVTDA